MREEIKNKLDNMELYILNSIPNEKLMETSKEYFKELRSLIERESEQKYTRKQVQKACANAYKRGVDNRPYIERFDEWIEDEEVERESGFYTIGDLIKAKEIISYFNRMDTYDFIMKYEIFIGDICQEEVKREFNLTGLNNVDFLIVCPLPNQPKSEEV